MTKGIVRALLGLSIIASGVAIASPTSAQTHQYKNYKNSNYCLSVQGGNGTPGTRIITWQCSPNNSDPAQKWTLQTLTGPWYQLRSSVSSAECIALQNGGSITDGTQAIIWTCDAEHSPDQGWMPIYQGTDVWGHACYYFRNYKAYTWLPSFPEKVLSVQGGTPAPSTNVVLWPLKPAGAERADQIWCEY